MRIYLELEVRRVVCWVCGAVKRERLDFLADNPFYTKRFAFYVGKRCRASSIKEVAGELLLDWHTVKELDKCYMREQLRRIGTPGPKIVGIDEIAIRKGHTCRIVVSDLLRRRANWFGGTDRSEASMDAFYRVIAQKKAKRIRLAVMDMWKAFRNSANRNAPQAAILFDKSTSCVTWATRSMRFARASTAGWSEGIAATSRGRNTHCCRAGRTSPSMASRRSRSSWPVSL